MKFFRTFALMPIMAVCLCNMSMANTSYPWLEWVVSANTEEASLFVLPDGTGPPLTQAMLFGGQIVDASIVLSLVTNWGEPVPGYFWGDISLDPETENAFACFASFHHGFCSDGDTDMYGETTFATSLVGGGWSEDPLWLYLYGSRGRLWSGEEHPPMPLRFNSADINADGVVDLIDVSLFAGDFFGEYHYRSDFRWDGVLNLMDCEILATGFGKICD